MTQVNPGAKHDTGKPRLDLVDGYFPDALQGVAGVCSHGAELHGEYTWDSIEEPVKRYWAAMRRHQLAIQKGELQDKDSGLPHEFHVAWNALALAQLREGKS